MSISDVQIQIEPLLRERGVLQAAIFGSFARGEETPKSDIDVLVTLPSGSSLLDLVDIKNAIEEKTKRKADVLTYKGIHPSLRERILKERKVIYE